MENPTRGWLQHRLTHHFPILRLACLLLGAAPFAVLLWRTLTDRLGTHPVETLTRETGEWTLILLCVGLAITPLRRLTGLSVLVRLRRMAGLFAFFYGCLHALTWVWFDQWFDLHAMWLDVLKRSFITVGMAALVLMVPLALTSSQAMMRRLGRHWSTLHRTVYLIVPLGVLHYGLLVKKDLTEPLMYGAVVTGLLLLRALHAWRHHRRQAMLSRAGDAHWQTAR